MRKHPVRKFLGLTVLYAAIIVGIFVIQFKTESVISKTIGLLRISLAQTETESNQMELKNQLTASFKGLTFLSSEDKPITALNARGESTKLILQSWEEVPEGGVLFTFKDGTTLEFLTGTQDDNASLSITVNPAKGFTSVKIPYKTAGSYSLDIQNTKLAMVNSKEDSYLFTAQEITTDSITFTKSENIASYTYYDPSKRFTYESTLNLANTDSETYNTTVKHLRDSVVTQFTQALTTTAADMFTEKEVSAYVAEMAQNGKFGEALDSVPESFKKGNKRTYFTSPYFDNLVNMNKSLVIQTEKYASMVQNALDTKNLDIFLMDDIASYLLREKRTDKIRYLLGFPARLSDFAPTVQQASGLIYVYTELYQKDQNLASLLQSVISRSVEVIADNCSIDNQLLVLTANDSKASLEQCILTGTALIQLGQMQQHDEYITTGRLLIYSALHSAESIDLHTAAELYPILAKDNKYYPHTEILGYYASAPVWAWTCASSISYSILSDNSVDVNIKYPLGNTHYVIFNGIPTFHAKIQIQKQMFRSDPRFETYNSSGYIYENTTRTLFIKSRHKSEMEEIILYCDPSSTFIDAATPIVLRQQ